MAAQNILVVYQFARDKNCLVNQYWASDTQVGTYIVARGQVGTQVVPGFRLHDAHHCTA
jgi:hypothetical protein